MVAFGILVLSFIIFPVIVYSATGFFIMEIARKTGHRQNAWMAWFPILRQILLLDIAQKPRIWTLPVFLITPFHWSGWGTLLWFTALGINFTGYGTLLWVGPLLWVVIVAVNVVVWMEIAVIRNKRNSLGVLAVVPVIGLYPMALIAKD